MKEEKKVEHQLVVLAKTYIDLNQQLKTIQGTALTVNEHGVKWDNEMESMLSFFFPEGFHVFLNEDYFFISLGGNDCLKFFYLIYGEKQEVYVDFNSIKETTIIHPRLFIKPLSNEEEKRYVLTDNPVDYKEETGVVTFITIVDALKQLEKETGDDEENWNISQFIEQKLKEKMITKTELADKVGIKYKTLISKFKINSITAEELVRMAIVLDIDLNELKSIYMNEEERKAVHPDKVLEYISSLIQMGFTSGLLPSWKLNIPQKDLYPITMKEQLSIAEQVSKGYITGYITGEYPRTWNLEVDESKVSGLALKNETIEKYQKIIKEEERAGE